MEYNMKNSGRWSLPRSRGSYALAQTGGSLSCLPLLVYSSLLNPRRWPRNIMRLLITIVSLLGGVSAHGYVQQIWLGEKLVDAWNPYKDPQKKPAVNKITRVFKDNGPVTDDLFMVRIPGILSSPLPSG